MDNETKTLFDEWERRRHAYIDQKNKLTAAQQVYENAANELQDVVQKIGGWLVPCDAEDGEQFNIWIDGRCLSCVRDSDQYRIRWRKHKLPPPPKPDPRWRTEETK